MRRVLIPSLGALALVGGLAAALIVAPCAPPFAALSGLGLGPAHCAAPPRAAEGPRAVAPPTVTVVAALDRPFVDRLFVSGTLVAREEAQVAAQIEGLTIVEIHAEDGDTVAAGQALARLDSSQIEAQMAQNDAATARADAAIAQAKSAIEQAQAQVSWASDDYDRAAKLGPQVMAAATIEQRETALRTARAQFAVAQHALAVAEADRKSRDGERRELQVKLAETEVKAPVGGLISRRTARLGAAAGGAGEPLFRIIKDGAVDLEAEAPEQALPRLAVGMSAELALPGVADKVAGTVRLISAEVDKASRTGKVRIALAPGAPAHIGGFASAEIVVSRSQGVGVPASAVARDAAGARALVVRDGVVEQRKVTVGVADGDAVEIAGGVKAGEMVVARAAAFLRPGDRVTAVTAVAEGATP